MSSLQEIVSAGLAIDPLAQRLSLTVVKILFLSLSRMSSNVKGVKLGWTQVISRARTPPRQVEEHCIYCVCIWGEGYVYAHIL